MPTYNFWCRDCGEDWITKEYVIKCPKCKGYNIVLRSEKPRLIWM